MLNRIIQWVKNNKLTVLLIGIVAFLIFGNPLNYLSYKAPNKTTDFVETTAPLGKSVSDVYSPGIGGGYNNSPVTPRLDIQDRKVVTTSNLSLLVGDVRLSVDKIENIVTEKKGYVVRSYMSNPEGGDNGQVELRVPSGELKSVLTFLREISVKVVYENIYGTDVTDQYVDVEARLNTLNTVKTRYEEIMTGTNNIDQILNIQQKIFSVQDQIDRLKGQLAYMDATSSSTLITVYLSTDELSLPYAPDDFWRPEVVFKLAVRSLIGVLRDLGSWLIWIGVYAVIWVPALALIILIRKILQRKRPSQQ